MSNRPKGTKASALRIVSGAQTPEPLITGCILALNEETRIEGAILSLAGLADRIIVIDNGSTDRTVEIAERLGAIILRAPRALNFDAIRNMAINASDTEWIFYLDADERIPPGMAKVLRDLIAARGSEFSAVCIPFKHYFCGKWIQHSGWRPGYTRPQLLKRDKFSYNTRLHGGVTVDGETIYLSADNPDLSIDHFSYDDLTHYICKLNNYTDGEAESLLADGGPHSWQAQLASFVHDWQIYYERGRGDLDGIHGFVLAFMSGFYRFLTRAKLWNMRRKQGRISVEDTVPESIREALELMARVAQEGSQPWCAPTYPEVRSASGRISPDWYKSVESPDKDPSRERTINPPPSRILACILARNEGVRIETALKSVVGWVDIIVVIDNASDDDTSEIARKYTPHVIYAPRSDSDEFDGIRNLAIAKAEELDADWVFFLDADEIVSQGLGEVIRRLVAERGSEFEAIGFPFQNWFYGKWMQCSVWWPGYKGPQLVKRGCFSFGERLHAGAQVNGRTMEFPSDDPDLSIRHNAYEDIRTYITKMNAYTSGEAVYLDEAAQPCTWQAMLADFVYEWQMHYDHGRGREDGMHGFVQSFLCAFYRFVARAKLWDLRRKRGEESPNSVMPGTLREMLEFMARVTIDGPAEWLTPVRKAQPPSHVPLLWRGPLWDASGYAEDGRSLVLGLIDGGEPICAAPEHWGDNLADLSAEQAEMIRVRTVDPHVTADLMVVNTLPWLLQSQANARFQIARTVFETNGLSPDWVNRLNSMDRIWVPSDFNKYTFANSGVDSAKIAVIPEAMDTELYATECEPLELVFGGECGLLESVPMPVNQPLNTPSPNLSHTARTSLGRGIDARSVLCSLPRRAISEDRAERAPNTERQSPMYRFLSIFDWMLHKGQDLLLEAFALEFGERNDVELVIKTWSSNHYTFEQIIEQADEMLLARTGKGLNAYPNIHIFQKHLKSAEMPKLYKACDCFVIPTRGDGWLRPLMEAMAAGLPTIATGWSGLTQYYNRRVGYPIKYSLVPVSAAAAKEIPVYAGHTWAEPALADLRRLMKYVESHRDSARKKGLLARKAIIETYSRRSVAMILSKELETCREMARSKPWPTPLTDVQPRPRIEQRLRRPRAYPTPPDPVSFVEFARHLGRPLRIRWEGGQDSVSSLSHVNRELCLGLLAGGDVELSLPAGIDFSGFSEEDAQRFAPLAACSGAELSGPPDVTIRHHWPPDWAFPETGKLIVIQPWELSHLPGQDWIDGAMQADEVWAYSRFVRDTYVRSGVPAEKVRVVPLGVRTDVFTPEGEEHPLPMHPITGKRPYRFLFIGGTIDRKGADILLPVYMGTFTRDSDVCLVVKDMGVNTYYSGQNYGQAYKRAATDPNAPMVVYLDSDMSEKDLAALYRSCDCIILPYRGEGFALSPLEGMSCALPAIVTAGGPPDDYLDDEIAYRVPYHRRYREGLFRGPGAFPTAPWDFEINTQALSQTLHRVNDDRAGSRRRGSAARVRVLQGWTWERAIAIARERLLEVVAPTAARIEPRTTLWRAPKGSGKSPVRGKRSSHSFFPHPSGGAGTLGRGKMRALCGGKRLSLVMIVRDEEARIRQCLESIAPFVDEIIIIDTGSTDRTREIARACGARVYDRAWSDSFAEARNAGIELATGDWIFWMDADDVISPECGAMLRELIDRHPNMDAAYQVQVRIPPGSDEFSTTVVDHVKLFPNRKEFRFEHRIHEQVLPSLRKAKIDVLFSDVYVTHKNYDRSDEGQKKKRMRDFRLLYLDLADHPDHPFVTFNLGMTYLYAAKDYEVAAHYLWRSLKNSDWRDSIVRKAYALLTTARICQEEWELAITANEGGRAYYPDDAELLFQAGQIYQQLNRFDEARLALERLLEGADDPHYRSVDTSLRGYRGRHEVALLHRRMGDPAHCERALRQIVGEQPDYLPAWQDLAETLVTMGREAEARSLMSALPTGHRQGDGETGRVGDRPTAPGPAPVGSGSQASPDITFINDCLVRARITLSNPMPTAERCVVTVVSPGYEQLLDSFLSSLEQTGGIPNALVVVFVVNGNDSCRATVARHKAIPVACTSLSRLNPTLKSVMYSAAHVVEADQYLCMDADMLITGTLEPLFAALDVCSPDSILVCPDAGLKQKTLGDELVGFYRGTLEDIPMLLGAASSEADYPLIVNDGIFAGNRQAMLALDATMRGMLPGSQAWVDALPDHGCRNQFLFNLALAHLNSGVALDEKFNMQLQVREIELNSVDGRVKPAYNGGPVHVLHFCGAGRGKHAELRDKLFPRAVPSGGTQNVLHDVDLAIMTVDRAGDYFRKAIVSMNPQKRVDVVVGSPSVGYLRPYTSNANLHVTAPTTDEWAAIEHQPVGQRASWNYWRCLMLASTRGKGLVILEDDIEFAKGWENRLARTIREIEAANGDNFLLSLYCAYLFVLPAYKRGELYTRYPLEVFAGTQGVYFPARIRADFRSHLKKHGVDSFRVNYDMILREYLQQNNIATFVTAPSLVQHKGLVGTGLSENRHYSPVFFPEVE